MKMVLTVPNKYEKCGKEHNEKSQNLPVNSPDFQGYL